MNKKRIWEKTIRRNHSRNTVFHPSHKRLLLQRASNTAYKENVPRAISCPKQKRNDQQRLDYNERISGKFGLGSIARRKERRFVRKNFEFQSDESKTHRPNVRDDKFVP